MALVGEAHILVKAITTGVQKDIDKAFSGADSAGEKAGRNAASGFSKGFGNSTDGQVIFRKFYTAREIKVFKKAREDFLSLARKGYVVSVAVTALTGVIGSLVGGLGVLALTVAAAAGPALLGLVGTLGAVAVAAAVLVTVFKGVGDALKAQGDVAEGAAERAKALARAKRDLEDANYNYAETEKEVAKRVKEAADAITDAADAEVDAKRAVESSERAYQDSVEATTEALEDVTKAREDAKEAIQQLRFELEGGVISEKKARLEFEKARESLQRVQDLPPNSRARREAELAFAEADLNLRRAIDKTGDLRKKTNQANKEGIDGNKNVLNAEKNLIKARQSQSDAEVAAYKSTKDLTRATLELNAAKEYAKKNGELEKKNMRDMELARRAVADATDAITAAENSGGVSAYAEAMAKLSPEAQKFVEAMKPIKEELAALKLLMQDAFFKNFTDAITGLANTYIPLLTPSLVTLAEKLGEVAGYFKTVFTTPEKQAEVKLIFDDMAIVVGNLGTAFVDFAAALVTLSAEFSPYMVEFSEFIKKKAAAFKNSIEEKKASGELKETLEKLTDVVRDLGTIFGNTFSTLGNLLSAATGPGSGGQLLLDYLIDVTAKWEKLTAGGDQNSGLKTFLLDLATNFTKLADVAGLLVIEILKIAASEGFGKFLDKLKEAIPIIGDIAENITKALPAFGDFIISLAEFLKLVVDAAPIELFFNILKGALDALVFVLNNPIGKAFLAFGGLLLAASAGFNLLAIGVGKYKASIMGSISNIKDMKQSISDAYTVVKAKTTALFKSAAATKIFAGAQKVLNAVLNANPILKIVAVAFLLVGALVALYKNNEAFREIVDKVWGAIKETIGKVVDAVMGYFDKVIEIGKAIWEPILAGLKFIWDAVTAYFELIFGFWKAIVEIFIGIGLIIWDWLSEKIIEIWDKVTGYWNNTVLPFITAIVGKVAEFGAKIWDWISDKIIAIWAKVTGYWDKTIYPFVSGIVKGVKDKAGAIWDFVSDAISTAWGKVTGFFDKTIYPFIRGIKKAVTDAASNVWDGLKSGLSGVINFIIDNLNKVIGAINWAIKQANKVKIGKDIKELELIKAVNLAEGGVVMPSIGGTLARIGEAGRPERVEPLDPDGLSKRDKAMIQLLAGNAGGGINITVNPSADMDERELANLVSRQLAFQLRKGAA
jgi:phage-related protein